MSLYVDITKKYKDFELSVRFECGNEVLSLLGPSGAGKSLTLKCIAGIEKPDRGRIVLDNRVLYDSEQGISLSPGERKVGFLFQNYALFPNMTVRQNILCSVRGKALSGQQKKKLADAVMSRMELTEVADHFPRELSGGQAQRTALARILVNDADLILLDEPLSALDDHLRFRVMRELEQTIAEFGKTVILVTHNRDEAYRLSDRIALYAKGKIDAEGTVKDIFHDPVSVNGAGLTGVKNIISAKRNEDGTVIVPELGQVIPGEYVPGGRVVEAIGIRMHSVLLEEWAKNGRNDHFSMGNDPLMQERKVRGMILNSVIQRIVETPFTFVITVQGDTGTATIDLEIGKDDSNRKIGDRIWVFIAYDEIMFLTDSR